MRACGGIGKSRQRKNNGISRRDFLRAGGGLAAAAALSGCPNPWLETAPWDPAADGHLLRLVHLTDPHITDDESPARTVRLDPIIPASWRPQEAYTVQVLDAMLRRVNAIQAEGRAHGRPIDLLVMGGDATELAQYNELAWFITTMDGGAVTPDSGAPDGRNRDVDPALNPKLSYQTEGLDPDIPWFTCYGNHDGLAVGNFHVDRRNPDPRNWVSPIFTGVAREIGLHDAHPFLNALAPTLPFSGAIIRGDREQIDPRTLQILLDETPAGRIAPDPARRFLSDRDFIAGHFGTRTGPDGHGFTDADRRAGRTWYSARPYPELPLRLIVLDTVAPDPPEGLPIFYGVMPRAQFEDFLKPALQEARRAGEWVIVVSHHPSGDFWLPFPGDTVTPLEFRHTLALQPNLIMHLSGHAHRHRVLERRGFRSYLEIETASLIDFPQESRLLDVFYDEANEALRIDSAIIGHMDAPTGMSRVSYLRSVIDRAELGGALSEAERERILAELFPGAKAPRAPAPLSKADRFGGPGDRGFSAVFQRPPRRRWS